jgi:tripartite-type tricarboxylate transporter receptor subunit TctC
MMIVPFPPGGQADFAARPMAAALEKILGHAVIVENRAGGAGGSIGNTVVARAAPDGYTMLMALSSLAVLPEADRLFGREPAYEVAMEMFAASAGIKLLHVPFRGAGPALTGVLSATVEALASAPSVVKPQVDAGKLRVLANWGAKRIDSFPNVPTFKELGYADVEFYIWAGIFTPKGVPEPVMTRLREAVRDAIKSPDVVRIFDAAGSPPAYQDAPEFAEFVKVDSARLIAAVHKMGKLE